MARTTIELSGPLFTVDIRKTFRKNAQAMLEGMAREGEGAIKGEFGAHTKTGEGRRGVRGRTQSLTGKRWELTMVISQTHVYRWPGGGQKQYRGGKLEARVHMFRRTTSALRRARALAMADLVKGLT